MPNVNSMFPKKYLSFQDFNPGEIITATIKCVQLAAAKATGNRGQQGQQPQVEPEWDIFFYEFPKPIRLRKTRAKIIASVLNESDTDRWNGKRISFYRGSVFIGGEEVEGLIFDGRPVPQLPSGAPNGPSLAAALLDPSKAGRPIPPPNMARFMQVLKQNGRDWPAFLTWLRSNCYEGWERVKNNDPHRVDAVIAPAMKRYLEEITTFEPPVPQVRSTDLAQVVESDRVREDVPAINEEDIPF